MYADIFTVQRLGIHIYLAKLELMLIFPITGIQWAMYKERFFNLLMVIPTALDQGRDFWKTSNSNCIFHAIFHTHTLDSGLNPLKKYI